jgi:PhzF family phenazine biosynthesis protein
VTITDLPDNALKTLITSLNLNESEIATALPPKIASTGLKDIVLGVKNADILYAIAPNFPAIAALSKQLDVIGIHVYACDSMADGIQVRNFAPACGIDEESATGTSNCALACTLANYNMCNWNSDCIFHQGGRMGSPSRITVRLGSNIKEGAWVGGKYRIVFENNTITI